MLDGYCHGIQKTEKKRFQNDEYILSNFSENKHYTPEFLNLGITGILDGLSLCCVVCLSTGQSFAVLLASTYESPVAQDNRLD